MAKTVLPYYKRYTRDLLDGTVGMGFELKTAYAFILDLIYHHDGALPDEPRYIAGHLECSVRKWNTIRNSLIELDKIQVNDGLLSNYRAVTETISRRKYSDNQQIKAQKPRQTRDSKLATARQSESEPESYDSIESNFDDFWKSYPFADGTNRNGAKRLWDALGEDDRLWALSSAKRLDRKAKYKPFPIVFLRDRLFEDSKKPTPAAPVLPPPDTGTVMRAIYDDFDQRGRLSEFRSWFEGGHVEGDVLHVPTIFKAGRVMQDYEPELKRHKISKAVGATAQ